MYLDKVFVDDNLKYDVLRRHMHFVIIDLLNYKIKPYNDSNTGKSSLKNKPKIIFKVEFVNKSLDMINLPRILRDKSLKSYVNFCKIKEPSVVFSTRPNISCKIFNYNTTVKEFADLNDYICKCSEHSNFINSDCGHVATGDVTIFKTTKLIEVLKKGPGYHEPVNLDFEAAYKAINLNIGSLLRSWSNKEYFSVDCFNGWRNRLDELVLNEINKLKLKYSINHNKLSVFSDKSVKAELSYFHKYFVLCPIDKASKNIAVICKRFYLETILNECYTNTKSYCDVSDLINISDICKQQKEYLKLNTSDSDDRLPHIVLFPKFHKPKLSQRFVVSYSSCVIKPLARNIPLGLKAVYKQICSYSNMIYKGTGINRNWIINNNAPILDCFDNLSQFSRAMNIQTFDFATLYTNLNHDVIKTALSSVIRLAFKHSKRKCIAIYSKSSAFVNSTRDGTWYFDESSLVDAVNYLMDNCYFTLGHLIFRQIIGVPIGVDPGPYIANLTLWFFENKYLEKLYKTDYFSAKLLNRTFRLIDDITAVNADGVFQKHLDKIYPSSLFLNNENLIDSRAHVLDLDININNGSFEVCLYDKREDFPFDIVQFAPASSNVPRNILYGVFGTQVIRYFRICSNFDHYENRISKLIQIFLDLGYNKQLLKNVYYRSYYKHKFSDKFGKIAQTPTPQYSGLFD